MIFRTHSKDGVDSSAAYSGCETYRYFLARVWDTSLPSINFLMLNPSTADERRNDPTIERCERRARQMSFGAFVITNIFAFRATDPRDLRAAARPEGPRNKQVLLEEATKADTLLAAWGAHGEHLGQGSRTIDMLLNRGIRLYHLGRTKKGQPRHPLYVPYSTRPRPWDAQ